MRPFVSDGIFERFTLQIAEQKDFNYRNQVDRVQVAEVRLVQVAGDSIFDLLTVGIRDPGRRLSRGPRYGQAAGRRHESDEFVEYWTFLRRRGVTTGDKPGLVEGQCPNCGAQIELNESARCATCGSLVRSGNFDWVLVEITQSAEWNDDAPSEPPGVAAYRAQRNPGLSVEHLEDRTSVIFWRKAMADRLGDVRPTRENGPDAFCADYPRRWGPDKALRRYWGDAAVGSVETLGILPGEAQDRALVEVRMGRPHVCRPGGTASAAGRRERAVSFALCAGSPGRRPVGRGQDRHQRRTAPAAARPRAIWPPMPASSAA